MLFISAKSLASESSQSVYWVCQVRAFTNVLRVQAPHLEHNVKITDALALWVGTQTADSPSLAGSGALYVRAQCRVEDHDQALVRFQVKGSPALNRDYGAVFIIQSPEIVQWLDQWQSGHSWGVTS